MRVPPHNETIEAALLQRPKIVLAHGCFDGLHAGHIEHLQEAKKHGDRLVVSITGDAFVSKGIGRPRFKATERAAHLRLLSFVDEVVINDSPTAAPMIEKIRPGVFVKGVDYAGSQNDPWLAEEIETVKRCGGRFEITQSEKLSSSRILARSAYGDELADYFDSCRTRGFLDRIEAAFGRAKNLRVAFVGETILDEYRYVAPLGKASKEYTLAVAHQSAEEFQGGVVAAHKHAAQICKTYDPVTQSISSIRKTRFVSQDFGRKLFEVYSVPTMDISGIERVEFTDELRRIVKLADAVVLLDFGHGLIDDEARTILKQSKFLAVNAQSNAGNHGYNSVAKYRHADYVCVDAPEARLAVMDQHGTLDKIVEALAHRMESPHLIVTNGRNGAQWKGGRVPPLTTQPKDTIGAGDAFLAVTAPLIAAGLGDEEAALVGNIAGAMKTEIVGHRAAIDGNVLMQSVKSLLK